MSYPIGTIITIEVGPDNQPVLEVCPKKRKAIKGNPQHFEVIVEAEEMELKPIPAPPAGTPVERVHVDRSVYR